MAKKRVSQNQNPQYSTDARFDQFKEARNQLWHKGILHWKLDITQKQMYDFFHGKIDKTITYNCSRRLGKSYFLTILAIEQCLQHPKSIIKMLQPEVKMIRMNIRPIMDKIFEDCPPELKPDYRTLDSIYLFPNGSEIHLAGTDNGNYEKLRGGDSHLAIIDEAGFCSELKYIINSILIPTTTLTGGRIILSSTTPPNPDHQFVKYMEAAETFDTLCRKTIYDAIEDQKGIVGARITPQIVADIIKAMPDGEQDSAFRTEYLCEIIHNSDVAVIPEFSDVQDLIVCKWLRPNFADNYVSMDIGFEDLTFVLFAYYDFDNSKVVVEDEIVISGPKMTTRYLAELIKNKETELWTNPLTGETQETYMRVSDNNLILINDLVREHQLYFQATEKHHKDQYVNRLRNMIRDQEIIINPKCKTLISHLKSATWNSKRTDFRRSPDNGHYDGVAALLYLIRNILYSKSPYPKNYRNSRFNRETAFFPEQDEIDPTFAPWLNLFKRNNK